MKKLTIWLMILALALASCAALAEAPTITADDVKMQVENIEKYNIQSSISSYASSGADAVSRDGSVYTVTADGLTFRLDLSAFPSFLCFTQDKYASFEAYLCMNDPNSVLDYLISENIHFYMYDPETNLEIYIYESEADELSEMVGDLCLLPSDTKALIGSYMAANAQVAAAGSDEWILFPDYNVLLNIRSGRYIHVEFGGSNDSAADLQDTLDVLSCLSFS